MGAPLFSALRIITVAFKSVTPHKAHYYNCAICGAEFSSFLSPDWYVRTNTTMECLTCQLTRSYKR